MKPPDIKTHLGKASFLDGDFIFLERVGPEDKRVTCVYRLLTQTETKYAVAELKTGRWHVIGDITKAAAEKRFRDNWSVYGRLLT